MATKPLAVRLLEQRKIAHEVFAFDPAIRDAGEVAAVTGHSPAEVYKTLVVEHDPPKGKPLLVMAPSDTEVDLKVLAAAVGAKKLRMASHRDAEQATGLQVGGISALALLDRRFPAYIDARAVALTHLLVSAGQRGFDVRLSLADLLALTGAQLVPLG
ncbi:MAG: aminoacyl-tRNA deacylase [Chloroflexi bacterium]|nr:aminoacyl-tRNA deacylase [Chloroflexota bacterium]